MSEHDDINPKSIDQSERLRHTAYEIAGGRRAPASCGLLRSPTRRICESPGPPNQVRTATHWRSLLDQTPEPYIPRRSQGQQVRSLRSRTAVPGPSAASLSSLQITGVSIRAARGEKSRTFYGSMTLKKWTAVPDPSETVRYVKRASRLQSALQSTACFGYPAASYSPVSSRPVGSSPPASGVGHRARPGVFSTCAFSSLTVSRA